MRRAALLALALAALALGACDDGRSSDRFYGYVEGEMVEVGAPEAGWIEDVAVSEGDEVTAGQLLFRLDSDEQRAMRDDAQAGLARARSELADLEKGERPEEIAAMEAQLEQAQANLTFAEQELVRQQKLINSPVFNKRNLERAQSEADLNRARVAELQRDIAVAKMPARQDRIDAARAAVEAAQAALRQAQWQLDQRTVTALVDGRVEEVIHRVGEYAAKNAPVIELLPPGNVVVRFFVPEPVLSRLRLGQPVAVGCDACDEPVEARISFIASSAEYTPPVIYSLDERSKLVYLIKARPTVEGLLRPGQPVDVTLEAAAS
jgi:HlyD family secretion protein